MSPAEIQLGAAPHSRGTTFGLFATESESCRVVLVDERDAVVREIEMDSLGSGYFRVDVEGVKSGDLYRFRVGEYLIPDPRARFLPRGVHGPSQVIASEYLYRHAPPRSEGLADQIFYELHVGTFTPEGTYRAALAKLPELVELGVTTLELLPLSSFPGGRGWGYDGVAHFAPDASYGSPDELREFVDAAHGFGLLVVLDVVYNHFGPAGNYLSLSSSRYFDGSRQTPWGTPPAFTDAPMRRYVIDNALYWLDEFRFDGLRLDAAHELVDTSEEHVVRELARRVRELPERKFIVIEDDRNDASLKDGWGIDATWADDFHHAVHVLFTREQEGYYENYAPSLEALARTIERGWLHDGTEPLRSGRVRGTNADELDAENFVYCLQNHDQIGNRALGERLHHLTDVESFALGSMLLLFLPMTPLLFMGQEWAASSPFLYFTDHEPELGALVSAGRRREFAGFSAFSSEHARAHIPDPQAEETFARSRLDWTEREREPHARVLELHRRLIHLRKTDLVMNVARRRSELQLRVEGDLLVVTRSTLGGARRIFIGNFGDRAALVDGICPEGAEVLLATRPLEGSRLGPRSGVIVAAEKEST